jgi:hypothetical protein
LQLSANQLAYGLLRPFYCALGENIGLRGTRQIMAREKSLDLAIVQTWLSAWNERDIFSDDAVRHLRSLITDPLCLVVVTLGVGHQPRSLVFRRVKQMVQPGPISPRLALKPPLGFTKTLEFAMGISPFPTMIVSPVAPVAPFVGQLWQQTGVKSKTVIPRVQRVLRWDGVDWTIAGLVTEIGGVMKQGLQVCDFQEALACAHEHARWFDCEFIHTYDGSTWGNA